MATCSVSVKQFVDSADDMPDIAWSMMELRPRASAVRTIFYPARAYRTRRVELVSAS
ncbi:hypothetical protein [Nitratireductor soli]|uniref:hypothetical protein n=1 Tax=Nitratireductor soli TaxID=1670619 RepID=UPI0019D1B738|nr:hypothetical protein [Nitratireductor soli]